MAWSTVPILVSADTCLLEIIRRQAHFGQTRYVKLALATAQTLQSELAFLHIQEVNQLEHWLSEIRADDSARQYLLILPTALFDTLPDALPDAVVDILDQGAAQAQWQFCLSRLHRQYDSASTCHTDSVDGLTGLMDKQHYLDRLKHVLSTAGRRGWRGAVLMLDIDNFKRVNSVFSFDAGDKVLQKMATRLSSELRVGDLLLSAEHAGMTENHLARISGDQFTLYLSHLHSEQDAIQVAQRCLNIIARPVDVSGQTVVLTGSIGLACFPSHGREVNMLMRRAEQAMHEAKKQGGSGYSMFGEHLQGVTRKQFQLENELRVALEKQQLSVYYQPQWDPISGQVKGMEALCRWFHPTLGEISPAEFIPVAEKCGLIVPLGDWVLQTACAQAAVWLKQGFEIQSIAVNVSSYQLNQVNFTQKLLQTLDSTGLPAEYLELELTESLIIADVEENIQRLTGLRKLGLTLAVDDFGTGYSSLSYLKRLPINGIKIDRSFIRSLKSESVDRAIVSAVLSLAASLNLKVIAEGVEEPKQAKFLSEHHCSLLQGFLFSPAVCAEQANELLQQRPDLFNSINEPSERKAL